jgi:hypothetical protein
MNGPYKLEHYLTICRKGFAKDKHSCTLGPFIRYEENKVLLIRLQGCWFKTQRERNIVKINYNTTSCLEYIKFITAYMENVQQVVA